MLPLRYQKLFISSITIIGLISQIFAKNINKIQEQNLTPTDMYNGGCVMPKSMRNGTYSLRGTLIVIEAGQLVPYNSLLQLDCPPGYTVSGLEINFCDNTKNDWFEELATCQKMCKPPKSLTVEFTCSIKTKNGQFIRSNCNDKIPFGTVATPKCRRGHHSITSSRKITCMEGVWGFNMPSCRAECGKTTPHGTVNVINGTNAVRGEFPWHAAIYSRYRLKGNSPSPNYWCGGSIISSAHVISAAHCFLNPLTSRLFNADLFTIAVGKLYSDFKHSEESMDPFIQKTGVKRIEIPDDYEGEANSYSHDIAILVLEKPLSFSNLIMPICLNLVDKDFDEDQSSPGIAARVAGFGLIDVNGKSSDVLKTAIMPIIAKNRCKSESPPEFSKYVVWDKLCAGYIDGIGVCKGDSGSGLVVYTIERNTVTWYLRGIVSTAPASESNDECSTNTYSTFSRPFLHKDFIEGVTNRGNCVMPKHPLNGNFILVGSRNTAPGQAVAPRSQISVKCNRGFTPSDQENNVCDEFIDNWSKEFPTCIAVSPPVRSPILQPSIRMEGCVMPTHPQNGVFEVINMDNLKPGDIVRPFSKLSIKCFSGYSTSSDINICNSITNSWKEDLGSCKKMCDSLFSYTVNFLCSIPMMGSGIQIVPCDRSVPSGTIATLKCEQGHYSVGRLNNLVCEDGSWDQTVPKCTATCGLSKPRPIYNTSEPIDSQHAMRGEFSWHVAIYQQERIQAFNSSEIRYICGGNIISRHHILSAAHCFYFGSGTKSLLSDIVVAVGKIYSKFNHYEEMEHNSIQKLNVKRIEIPAFYNGLYSENANDLAILVLETPLIFSDYVMPVCLDLDHPRLEELQSYDGQEARVAGFGFENPNGPIALKLKALTLSVIDFPQCRRLAEEHFVKFITPDKICAGTMNDSNLCKGDSGGGLVLSSIVNNKVKWNLIGIATVAPTNNDHQCNMDSFSVFIRPFYQKYFIESILNSPV